MVGSMIQKKTTRFWMPISAPERLALTLRYLATGESRQSLSFSYRVGKATVSKIVSETSSSIYIFQVFYKVLYFLYFFFDFYIKKTREFFRQSRQALRSS